MLKLLRRKKVAKRIFYALAVIIIPAFVIWGSASVINKSKTPDYAGIIFGKKVSFDEFQDALHAWKTQLKLQYGDKAEEIASAFFNPTQAVWDRLILFYEANRRKIKISDDEVIAKITSFPFLERGGRFDPRAYELFLKYSLSQSAKLFEEHLRQNLAMARVYDRVTQKIFVSDEEIRKEYEQQNIKTRLKYVVFSPKTYKDKILVTDNELKSYYDANKEQFKVPPQINMVYVRVDVKKDAPEEEKTKAKKTMEETYAVARRKGFKEATKQFNLEVKETGFLGFEDPIAGLGWVPQLSSLLFNLPQGAISQIVEMNEAAYIFKIKERKEAYIPEFKDTSDKVKDKLILQKAKDMARQKAENFLAKVKTATPPEQETRKRKNRTKKGPSLTFQKAAEQEGLEIKETPLFSKEGYISELGMAQPLKDAAFNLPKDAVADKVIELEGGFYVVKSIETIPINEEKFNKEKDEFAKQLLDQKRNKAFDEFFQTLKKRANLTSYIDSSIIK